MMSKEKRRVPKLRFPGFTEDWEQRKLSEVTTCFDNLRVPVTASDRVPGKIPYYGANGIQDYVSGHTHSGEFVLIAEDGANDLNDYPIQYVNGAIWVNNHAHVIAGYKEKLENKFLSYSLKTVKMTTFIVGGGRSKLNLKALLEIPISMPNYDEQCVIGKFIETIDINITLHQRKLNNLKLKKKALLQKLFPKNGKRYPELRFPGFTDAWEQRKLSDILVERNEQQVETNEYPLMSFVQGHGVIPKGERYDRSFLVLDQSKKYKRTELGDFIYSSNNLETGPIGINKTGKAVISPVYSIFYGVSIGDSQFIGIMSLLPRFIAKMIRFRQGVVYGQWRIHEKDFLDISILIPSEAERTKITKLILSIEELITLHQRKLDHLQLQKKALLQQMFV